MFSQDNNDDIIYKMKKMVSSLEYQQNIFEDIQKEEMECNICLTELKITDKHIKRMSCHDGKDKYH
jgi:hypothetical protein